MKYKPHSRKQNTVVFSKKRIVIAGTGIQWGKTDSGVVWLKTMQHRYTDPLDNFIVTSPTYKILEQSTLPPFLARNKSCGNLNRANMCFTMHNGGKVWFRTGTDPDSVVGITNVRAILCDEAGKYSRYFWDNIQARSSFKAAPIRIVTSPYSLNWLYTDFIRPYKKGDDYIKSQIDLVQASSKENPYFPAEEFEHRRRTMDSRRFNMIYGGQFDKAEGLVYDCFDQDIHQIDKFKLPNGTRVIAGVDWGYRDPFVISVRAISPEGVHYKVAEHFKPQQTIGQMTDAAVRFKNLWNIQRFYCDPSRPEYISHFCQNGLSAVSADNDIRLGIDRHYELIKSNNYYVFRGSSPHGIDEYEQYHYPELKDSKLDAAEKDELPVDNSNHVMDSERYITLAEYRPRGTKKNRVVTHSMREKTLGNVYRDTEIEKLKRRKRNHANVPL